jgi:hypothetical protein
MPSSIALLQVLLDHGRRGSRRTVPLLTLASSGRPHVVDWLSQHMGALGLRPEVTLSADEEAAQAATPIVRSMRLEPMSVLEVYVATLHPVHVGTQITVEFALRRAAHVLTLYVPCCVSI